MYTTQDTKTKTKTVHLEKIVSPLIIEKTSPEQPDNPTNPHSRSNNGFLSGDMSGDAAPEQPHERRDNNPKTEHDFDPVDPVGRSGDLGDSFSEKRRGVSASEGSKDPDPYVVKASKYLKNLQDAEQARKGIKKNVEQS